jgi:hypothetical protein
MEENYIDAFAWTLFMLVIIIALLLIFRGVVLWYFKITKYFKLKAESLKLQKKILDELQEINSKIKDEQITFDTYPDVTVTAEVPLNEGEARIRDKNTGKTKIVTAADWDHIMQNRNEHNYEIIEEN